MFARTVLALVAALFSFQALSGQTVPDIANPVQPCAVQGRITDAMTGQPVKNANVQLRARSPHPDAPSYAGTSQIDGTYKFENVGPGYYNLIVHNSGYAESAYHGGFANRSGDVLNLRPGQQLANIDVALTPLGVITGKVVDQDGDPVANASVAFLTLMWSRGLPGHFVQNGAITNDLGQFRIINVRPGKYYLFVQRVRSSPLSIATPGTPDVRPVRTYLPNALTLDEAKPFTISNGQQLKDMDIRLRTGPTFHIRGTVSGAIPDIAMDSLRLAVAVRGEPTMPVLSDPGTIAKDHGFDLSGLAPGSYTLCLMSTNGPLKLLARQDIEVGQGDVSGIQLVISPIVIQGQIAIANAPSAGVSPVDLKSLRLNLHAAEAVMMSAFPTAAVNEDGTFTLANVAPGKYDLMVFGGAAPHFYEASAQFDNREIGGQQLDVTHGGGQLNITLRYGPAGVTGIVPEVQNRFKTDPASHPDVTLALVGGAAPQDFYGIIIGDVRHNGTFFRGGIPPGHYRAYAIEKLDPAQLQNPNLLKALQTYGTELNFVENDKKQIQLPLITADKMQQIYAQAGIDSP